jgi:hypothetical protein
MIIRGPKNRWGVIQKLEKPKTNIFSNYFKSKLQQKKREKHANRNTS